MPEEFFASAQANLPLVWDYLYLVVGRLWFVWVPIFLYLLYKIWIFRRQVKWAGTIEWDLIAISVPADNVKDPKSMEQIITGIHSMEKSRNFFEKNFFGEFQLGVSLEIVGIDGHVRFLMRMPNYLRESIESLIYAYYPEAEIMLVEDYVVACPKKFPDDKWELYGTEAVLTKEDAYPIRTYKSFAEDIEQGFIDPIAALTEAMSSFQPGEQLWFQIIIRPRWDDKWKEETLKVIDQKMGRKAAPYKDWFRKYLIGGWHGFEKNIDTAMGWEPGEDADDDGGPDLTFLSPGEREVLKAIEDSMAKIAFQVKMRFIYLAKKEVYNKPKGIMPMFAYMRIFTTENLNGLKPNTKNWTSVDYFKKRRLPLRQQKISGGYVSRDVDQGSSPFVMSTEEIATLYHFPYESVKAPTIERAAARKAEPPVDLPLG